MLTGSAQQTLDVFKQILSDFQQTVGSQAIAKLVTSIKNTMSDRHIVQKNFNCLLEEYPALILPEVITSWHDLSSEEQHSMSSLNNFFMGYTCSLEWMILLHLHYYNGKQLTFLKIWLAMVGVLVRKSDSGTVRLVRTTCKALSKHGSEHKWLFTAYLSSNGIPKNPLASFRSNILFYDAGTVYHISSLIEKFFTEVWQTSNQLLRAVLSDVKVPEYLAGCKALGLVNKMVTGPLWRVLESQDISILDMNEKFCHLKSCLEQWSQDAVPVLTGEAVLYNDFPPMKDHIFESLVAPSVYDATVQEVLEILFNAFSTLISRLVADHLPDGKYHNPSTKLITETKSVPTTNVIGERDFANLIDFCVRNRMQALYHWRQ